MIGYDQEYGMQILAKKYHKEVVSHPVCMLIDELPLWQIQRKKIPDLAIFQVSTHVGIE